MCDRTGQYRWWAVVDKKVLAFTSPANWYTCVSETGGSGLYESSSSLCESRVACNIGTNSVSDGKAQS